MNDKKDLYESPHVWDQNIQLGQVNVVQAIIDFFPVDVETVLDVGCGDGKLTKAVIQAIEKNIIGLDSSVEALSRCDFPTVLGDASALPYSDSKFDLVITVDTFEHLPDDVESKAWHELFRVANKYVIVVVPYKEELLDAVTKCAKCDSIYHVNWHYRSYDWRDLFGNTPAGWEVELAVLTGEAWSPYHPIETRFRRIILSEWSGWVGAVCPTCGAPGSAPTTIEAIPRYVAAALGNIIYDIDKNSIPERKFSEILVLFRHKDEMPRTQYTNLSYVNVIERNAGTVKVDKNALDSNLIPYPNVARTVKSTDGGIIIQFPIYSDVKSAILIWSSTYINPINISIEDGLGVLFSNEIVPSHEYKTEIKFQRKVVPGYYGILIRIPFDNTIISAQLGAGPAGIDLLPSKPGMANYCQFKLDDHVFFIQVFKSIWFNRDSVFDKPLKYDEIKWLRLFQQIEKIVSIERDLLERRLDELTESLRQQLLRISDNEIRLNSLQEERRCLSKRVDTLIAQASLTEKLLLENQILREEVSALIDRSRQIKDLETKINSLIVEREAIRQKWSALNDQYKEIISRPEIKVSTLLRSKINLLKSGNSEDG